MSNSVGDHRWCGRHGSCDGEGRRPRPHRRPLRRPAGPPRRRGETLDGLGITYKAINCDVTDRKAVDGLLETASGLGTVASVIHTAGVSPSMGSAEYVMRTNAVGTVNVNEAFYASAGEGAAIVNVASMAAHMLPENMVPTKQFPQALQDQDAFMTDMLAACSIVPEEMQSGIAYAVSKSFVRWYSIVAVRTVQRQGPAHRLRLARIHRHRNGPAGGGRGAGAMVADAAVPRWGKPEEMADLLAFCASDKAGYLTGTDILNDGGVIASMTQRAAAGGRQRLGRQTTSTQMVNASVKPASTASRIESTLRSSVASDFSRRSSRASRNNGNVTLIAITNAADDVGPYELHAEPARLDDHQDRHREQPSKRMSTVIDRDAGLTLRASKKPKKLPPPRKKTMF